MVCAASHENLGRNATPLIFPPETILFFKTRWQKFGINMCSGHSVNGALHSWAGLPLCRPQARGECCVPGAAVWALILGHSQQPLLPPRSLGLFAEGVSLHLGPAPPGAAMETSRCFPKHSTAESPCETWDAVAAKDFPAPGLSDYFLFTVNCFLLPLW